MAGVVESILLDVQVKGTDALQGIAKHLTDIGDAAAASAKKMSKFNRQAGRLASSLDTVGGGAKAAGEGLKAVGAGARAASSRIKGAGDASRKTARRTEALRDRLGDVATMFRDSGDGGMVFADALDAMSVATTPLGAGILGVVAAAGALVVAVGAASAAVSAYIQTSDSAQASSKNLSSGFEELTAAIGGIIFEGSALGDIFDAFGQTFSEGAASLNAYRTSLESASSSQERLKGAIGGVIGMFGPLAERLASVTGLTNSMASAFSAAAAQARELRRQEAALAMRRAENEKDFAESLAELDDPAVRQRALAERQAKAKRIAAAQGRELSFEEMYMLGFEGATSPTSFEFGVGDVEPVGGRRGGGGGGGRARKEREAAARRAAENLALVSGPFGDPSFLAARAAEGGNILVADRRAREAAAAAAKEDEQRQRQAAKLREERLRALEAEAAAVARLAGTYREALQGSLAGLGVTAATTFGEMTAGAISAADAMRSLAKEILGVGTAIGRTAAQRGVEGLIAGTAGAGGVLAGGLGIAAGAGVLGAILARRQRRRERGRGGDSTARLAESIDRLEQTLRPDRADTPVTLNAEIVIAGRTVQQELTGALDSIVRTRSSRELFRAGIGR